MSEGLIFHPVICLSFYSSIHPFFLSPSLPSFIPSSLLFFLFFLPFSPSFHPFIYPYIHLFTHLSICSSSLPPFLLSFHHPSFPSSHPAILTIHPSIHSLFPIFILCIHPSICSTYSGYYVPGPCSGCWPHIDREDKHVGFLGSGMWLGTLWCGDRLDTWGRGASGQCKSLDP